MFHALYCSPRPTPKLPAFILIFLILSAALPLQAQTPQVVTRSISLDDRGVPGSTKPGTGPAYHPTRVLVRFRTGIPATVLPGSGPARAFPGDPNLFLVVNPPGISVAEAVGRYRANPNVLYAEPDYVFRAITIASDPLWSQQWDMAKISAPAAWDTQTDASDVVVVVIDTGIDYTHPDLQGNVWVNPQDSSHGYSCFGSCVAGGADDFGHGTHVAGTIGATANNLGIAGINWRVQLLSIKFLDSNGSGYDSDAVLAFDKVTALKQQGFNIRLTSNSWGGDTYAQALKDAMTRAEAAGIVHVCAAGNSGQNADGVPMYPAAYDNRGIISVGATDQNDAGAGFTNYGLSSVDIMAPGVSTLSTVPTAACALCDPSGYKLLSGTSMATPHVSGVLAAMFHKNPALEANEARDVLLDPASYDTVTDTKAKTTSTGGRLNFAKAISNPLLLSPTLNNFPTIATGPNVFASPGSQVNLSAGVSDADNDPLRLEWTREGTSNLWLFGWALNSQFPAPTGGPLSFTAPSLGRIATVAYDASVADGRGGGAHSRDYVTVSPAPNPGQPPSGTLTVNPTDAPPGSTITVNFPTSDPDGGETAWDLWIGMMSGASGTCCLTGTSATFTLNNAGVYRVGTQAIDRELNLSSRQSAVVRIGGATGEPPIARATFDKLSGTVPLTVNIDMSTSSDPDGTIQNYFFNCGGGAFTPAPQTSNGSCTYETPGAYWIGLEVQDSAGNLDPISAYAVATPIPDGARAQLSITSPTDRGIVPRKTTIPIQAVVSAPTTSVSLVEIYVGSTLTCSDTPAAFSCNWSVPAAGNKTYQLKANGYDSNGRLILTSNTITVTTQ